MLCAIFKAALHTLFCYDYDFFMILKTKGEAEDRLSLLKMANNKMDPLKRVGLLARGNFGLGTCRGRTAIINGLIECILMNNREVDLVNWWV